MTHVIVLPTGSSINYGAIADYIDLRTAVVEEVGEVSFIDRFPRMVQQAESRLSRMLRVRDMIATTTVTVSGGVGALPANCAEIIAVVAASGLELTARTQSFAAKPQMCAEYVVEGSQIRAPDADYTLQYYAALPTITGSNTATNWLLQKHPETYLWAVTEQVLKSLRRVDEAQQVATVLEREIRELVIADGAARYAQSVVTMRGDTP